MARRYGDPFKGNVLNRLSHFKARPVNRDALRVVEPDLDSKRRRPGKAAKVQPAPTAPKKAVFKKQLEEARRKARREMPVPIPKAAPKARKLDD